MTEPRHSSHRGLLFTPGFSKGDFLPVICHPWWQRQKGD